MKDTPEMMKREISFMKRNKAPKDMIKHEVAEHKVKKMATGGVVRGKGCATKDFGFGQNG